MSNNFNYPEDQTILIVDDEKGTIKILENILNPLGYKINSVNSGEAALNFVQKQVPDLILLDVMMPGIDGFETCRQIKNIKALDEIPIIFITAKNDMNDLDACFNAGGVDYISKPVNPIEVRARVKTHAKISFLLKQYQNLSQTLEVALNAQTMHLCHVGHELRTPLNAIINYSDMITESATEGECNSANKHDFILKSLAISNAGNYLLQIVNNVLDITKISAGKMEIFNETFDINELLNDVHTTMMAVACNNNNHIDVQYLKEDVSMHSDLIKVKQILINLMGNACKFTQKGTIIVDVNIEQEQVIFSVSDNGIGIDEDKQGLLFTEFTQADNSISRQYGGSGLGLMLCKQFCKMMEGQIMIESKKNQGSTFTVILPRLASND